VSANREGRKVEEPSSVSGSAGPELGNSWGNFRGESNESWRAGRGFSPRVKEIIGDTVLSRCPTPLPPRRNSYSVESSARITS